MALHMSLVSYSFTTVKEPREILLFFGTHGSRVRVRVSLYILSLQRMNPTDFNDNNEFVFVVQPNPCKANTIPVSFICANQQMLAC